MGFKSFNFKSFDRDPARQDILNSMSNNYQNKYRPTILTFTSNIAGLKDQFSVPIEKLDHPETQDVYFWIRKIQEAQSICAWTDEQSIIILKLLVTDNLHHIFESKKTLSSALETIKNRFFNSEKFNHYRNLIYRTKAKNFKSLQDYLEELNKRIDQADWCQPKSEAFRRRDRFEFFMNGLSLDQKLKIIEKQIFDPKEAVEYMSGQSALINQFCEMKNNQSVINHTYKESESGIPSPKKVFCSYHKSNRHSNEECKAQKNPSKNSTKPNVRNNNFQDSKSLLIQDKIPNIKGTEILIEINGQKCKAILDSGSDFSLINHSLSTNLNLTKKTRNIPIVFKSIGGDEIESIHSSITDMKIEGIIKKSFIIELLFIPTTINEIILGKDFLVKYNVILNFHNQCIIIDNDYVKMPINDNTRQLSEPDRLIVEKNTCFVSQTAKLPSEIDNFLLKTNTLIGKIRNIKHTIPLKEKKFIQKKPYPIPYPLISQTKAEINRLLTLNIIRKSQSHFASPAFPILKKDESIRLVVDYRELNSITDNLAYPFPNIMDQLRELNGSRIFSQIDLNCGYYQIEMAEEDVSKTAFVLPFGQYEFLRMPFGLTDAPRTFQKAMHDLLGHLDFVKIFLDDVLIHSPNHQEHRLHLMSVFKIFEDSGITINLSKSQFFKNSVQYLGHIIDENGIKPVLNKLNNFDLLKIPKSKKEIMKIIGLLNWFRPYISQLSTKISPITNLLKENKKRIEWKNEHSEILKKIIQEIKQQPCLSHPDYTKPFILQSDASNIGVGSILLQENKIIGIFSKKLNEAQQNYTVAEKEALAIVLSLQFFKNIVYNSKIKVLTDHSNLTFLTSSTLQRCQRWKIALSEFNLEIEYIPGINNNCADSLSRAFLSLDLNSETSLELQYQVKIFS